MANGWFAFTVITSLVLCTGCILAVAIMRAAWAQREREALTSNDLTALEESALYLIEQLKAEADRGIAELETRKSEIREMMADADALLSALRDTANQVLPALEAKAGDHVHSGVPTEQQKVLQLAKNGMEPGEIAKALGLSCAEVNLMLGLAKATAN